jgi:ABC-type uncharacterized transport system auxiliary subunit
VQTCRILKAALVFLLAGIVAGCGASRPVKYYVLDIGSAPANPAAPTYAVSLVVTRVQAAHLYRDDRLVYGSGHVELGTYEYERWAEVPADMIEDMLLSSLRTTGAYRSVSRIGSSVRGDYLVRGHLYALDEVEAPALAARFSFQLELVDPKTGGTIWSDTYSHDEPVNGGKHVGVADVVEALDRNVQAGLQQITGNLGQYFAAHPPQTSAAQ